MNYFSNLIFFFFFSFTAFSNTSQFLCDLKPYSAFWTKDPKIYKRRWMVRDVGMKNDGFRWASF